MSVQGQGQGMIEHEGPKKLLAHGNETLSTVPISSKWYWLVCVTSFITQIIVLGIHLCFGIIFVTLIDNFDASKAEAAFAGSLALSICYLFVPISRRLCCRFGFRAVTISGGAVMAFGLFLTTSAPNIVIMYLTYSVIFGFGSSLVFYASSEVVSKSSTQYRYLATIVMSLKSGVPFVSMARFLNSQLADYGFADTFYILFLVSLIICLCGATFHPSITQDCVEICDPKRNTKEENTLDITLCKSPAFVALTVAISLGMLFYYVPHIHLVRHCVELNFSITDTVFLYYHLGVGSTFGRLVFSTLNNMQCIKPLYLFQLSLLGVGIAMVTIAVADTWVTLKICSFAIGFFDSGVFAPLSSVVAEFVQAKSITQGRVFIYFIMGLSSMFGPPVTGLMADRQMSYRQSFFVAGGTVTAGACALTIAKCFFNLPGDQRSPSQRRQTTRNEV